MQIFITKKKKRKEKRTSTKSTVNAPSVIIINAYFSFNNFILLFNKIELFGLYNHLKPNHLL